MSEEAKQNILEFLEEKIRNAKTAEEAKEYAEAYKTMQEADSADWNEVKKNETEIKKARWIFAGSVLAALLTAGLKIAGDLAFQDSCQRFEDAGAYCNYKKHKR